MNFPARPPAQNPGATSTKRASSATLLAVGFGLFLVVVGLISGGVGGALVMGGIFALFTGMYTVLTGRASWARLAGRKAGAVVAGVSVLALMVGGSLQPAVEDSVPTAVAEQTEDASPAPSPETTTAPVPSPETTTAPAPSPETTTLLETLPIKGRAPKTGYDRDQFGQAWPDVDRNGCDTRNDMLNRDLRDIVHTNSVPCKVRSGVLDDPYTGTTISFLRGQDTSSDVQIDHVVALADAWQKGAQQLTFEERVAFANDPLNLQSTDGPTNQQKGAGDAATWLPPNRSFRCEYVARQISVKATYKLWVTQAEYDAMARVLSDCSDQSAPASRR